MLCPAKDYPVESKTGVTEYTVGCEIKLKLFGESCFGIGTTTLSLVFQFAILK